MSTVAMRIGSDKIKIPLFVFLCATLVGCDRMMTPRDAQLIKDAESKATQGDYLRAINLFEAALDDSPRCADIHYKLALLYDDKLSDPLNALHHYKRYLTLSPNGTHASEVREFMKRDQVILLTSLSGDSMITQSEAARLRNENLALHKQLDDRSAKPGVIVDKSHSEKATSAKSTGPRSYTVESGDTLFSISRKFYKSPSHWKEIRDANRDKVVNAAKLKPGEQLTIP